MRPLFAFFALLFLGAKAFALVEEKPFVLVIPSYNNEAFVEKCLRCVYAQNYANFRVIYIDDHSSDQTLKKTRQLLKELDKQNRATLIHNSHNQGALANIYNAVHSCLDHEIIILVDGDDFLAHENVLKKLNEAYADPNIWLACGSHLEYPSFQKSKPCSLSRKGEAAVPALCSFYSALFKHIPLEDLFYRGRFYSMAWDLAIMMPMFEMAKKHTKLLDDTLYLLNTQNPISDSKINPLYLAECASHIRAKTPYSPLKRLQCAHAPLRVAADLVIFSKDSPENLYALLQSIENYVEGLNKISVLYRSTTNSTETGYLGAKLQFPKVYFVKQEGPPGDFKRRINQIAFDASHAECCHILFTPDTLLINEPINLSEGICALEETKAYGLYYRLHTKRTFCTALQRYQPLPLYTALPGIASGERPLSWQFYEAADDFNTPNNTDFTLYRKEDLKALFLKMNFHNPKTLLFEWGQHPPKKRAVGLFFENSFIEEIASK